MEQGQVALSHIVIVDLDIDPTCILCDHALASVVDYIHVEIFPRGGVDAIVEFSRKQVHTHDAEDEPEDQTHQQHIKDGGNGPDKGIYHHLPITEDTVWVRITVQK